MHQGKKKKVALSFTFRSFSPKGLVPLEYLLPSVISLPPPTRFVSLAPLHTAPNKNGIGLGGGQEMRMGGMENGGHEMDRRALYF